MMIGQAELAAWHCQERGACLALSRSAQSEPWLSLLCSLTHQ